MTLPKTVALYARVSSQKQADDNTSDSQLAALRRRVLDDQFQHQSDMEFCDNGYSGSDLLRPALERLRDLIATSTIDRRYVHSPDRLSREMAHQAIFMEEFRSRRHRFQSSVGGLAERQSGTYHVAASLRDAERVSERLAYVTSGRFSSAARLERRSGTRIVTRSGNSCCGTLSVADSVR